MSRLFVVAFAALVFSGQASPSLRPDPAITCSACDEWNQPREPFRIFGNAYFVGTAGLSAILVTSDRGHILLDGGLSQSAPLIDPQGCRALAATATKQLDARVAEESGKK